MIKKQTEILKYLPSSFMGEKLGDRDEKMFNKREWQNSKNGVEDAKMEMIMMMVNLRMCSRFFIS